MFEFKEKYVYRRAGLDEDEEFTTLGNLTAKVKLPISKLKPKLLAFRFEAKIHWPKNFETIELLKPKLSLTLLNYKMSQKIYINL